jgi:hypothetical protein
MPEDSEAVAHRLDYYGWTWRERKGVAVVSGLISKRLARVSVQSLLPIFPPTVAVNSYVARIGLLGPGNIACSVTMRHHAWYRDLPSQQDRPFLPCLY